MNKLSTERRAGVIAALVEGNSIRSTVRMTGAAKNTVAKLLVELGQACAATGNHPPPKNTGGTVDTVPPGAITTDSAFPFSRGDLPVG